MIDLQAAQRIVLEHLAKVEREIHDFSSAPLGHENKPYLHLVVANTIEYDFGWVFIYDTREHLETSDIKYSVVGNAPLIVDKNDGHLYITGTAHPVEHYVEQYRRGVRTRA